MVLLGMRLKNMCKEALLLRTGMDSETALDYKDTDTTLVSGIAPNQAHQQPQHSADDGVPHRHAQTFSYDEFVRDFMAPNRPVMIQACFTKLWALPSGHCISCGTHSSAQNTLAA